MSRTLEQLLPEPWKALLSPVLREPFFAVLSEKVAAARKAGTVYPPESATFRALELTPPDRVKAVILGQDPYHEEGQAHGLAFSVENGTALPRSLVNVYKELTNDLGWVFRPATGDLTPWAKQGVLLLNTTLTVNAHAAASHSRFGWETFTDAVIAAVSRHSAHPVAFLLWGNPARRKAALIDSARHAILESAHPSPLSASRGFFGSRPFSRCNDFLRQQGLTPIDWSLS